MVHNAKKFCLLQSMPQEPYIIWLSFMVHICKMIIFSGVFFFFSIFWFSGSIGGKRATYGPEWQKTCRAPYLRKHTSCDCHLWCKYVKWLYVQVFFSILKFWFSGLSGGWNGKKWPKMTENSVFLTPYLRNDYDYIVLFWVIFSFLIYYESSYLYSVSSYLHSIPIYSVCLI